MSLAKKTQSIGLAPGTLTYIGERQAEKIKIQVINYSPQTAGHFYLDRAQFMEENTEPGALIGMTGSGSSGSGGRWGMVARSLSVKSRVGA